MRIREVLLLTAAIILFINPVFANSDNSVRIAVIAEKTSDFDKSPLISLLEVELSQKEGVKLLERAVIDNILEEQQLSAAGLLDRNATIEIGKLLRADAFIILSLENKVQDANDLIRMRISETAHGLRLLDSFEQSNRIKPHEPVERIVQKIESVLTKINQPDEKLIPVGIVNIHRVQLGEQYKMLERTLPTMLSVRLSLEPQIIILEREDLKTLLDEKLMTEGSDTEFWSSTILIDGYIQSNNGQLEMYLNLKQAAGDILKSITLPIDPNEAIAAIDNASTEITKEVHHSPTLVKWNPEQEAEQYYNKAQMLIAHGRDEEAIPLFETAHTLQFQNVYYTGTMFEIIWKKYRENIEIERKNEDIRKRISETSNTKRIEILSKQLVETPAYPCTYLELANMASVLVRQICDNYEKGKLSGRDIYANFSGYLGQDLFGINEYFSRSASTASKQIKLINNNNRKIYIDTFGKALQKQPIYPNNPKANQRIIARLTWIRSDNPKEIITNIRRVFSELVISPEFGGKTNSFKEREENFSQIFATDIFGFIPANLERTHLKGATDDFVNFWLQYAWELADTNDLFISTKGVIILTHGISNLSNKSDIEKTINYINNKLDGLVNELINSKSSLKYTEKEILLSYITNIMSDRTVIDYAKKKLMLNRISNYLIKEKDINNLVKYFEYLPYLGPSTPELERWRYHFMGNIVNVAQTNNKDVRVKTAIARINNRMEEIKRRYPQLNHSQVKANLHATIILNQKEWVQKDKIYESEGIQATIQDNMLWVVLFNYDGIKRKKDDNSNSFFISDIIISGIDLGQKQERIHWLTHVPISVINLNGSIKNLIIGKKVSYLTVQYGGILQFPGTDFIKQDTFDGPKLLNHKNGLPSYHITSIAQYGDKLLVAYGNSKLESGLGIYDPVTEEWETIFCSTLQGEHPFSSGQTYKITSMLYAKPDKLFLIVSELNKSELWKSQLWKVNIKTHESNYIRTIEGEFITDTNNTWIKSSGKLIKFDPVSESMKLTIRTSMDFYRRYPKNIPDIYGLDEDLFLPETFLKKVNVGSIYTEGNLDISTGAIHNNKLWSRYGKNKIIIAENGGNFENAQIIENDILNGKPVYKFISTPYGLVGIGEGIVGLIISH
ncbi:MAG: hypothetical protein JXA96_16040 [Sedimentisphaerales bacterium]|nr:hypothetical protein [Sedimentisphaerales bacterium]